MSFNRRHKILAATGFSTVAAAAVVGSSFMQYTDRDTSGSQVLTAGTVQVDVVEGAGWTSNLTNLAMGDSMARDVLLDNSSTLDVKGITLTTDVTSPATALGGVLADRVTVTISQGSDVLANDVALTALDGTPTPLAFAGDLPAGVDAPLTFDYKVNGDPLAITGERSDNAANADNKYQGASLSVSYTINSVQRDGVAR